MKQTNINKIKKKLTLLAIALGVSGGCVAPLSADHKEDMERHVKQLEKEMERRGKQRDAERKADENRKREAQKQR